jgi:DMSO/TMAO reductase YedYZ heme-binding membrane subunit
MTAVASASPAAGRLRRPTLPLCGAVALAAALVAALSVGSGADPVEGWRLAARHTARLAFLCFLPVYVASAWHRLAPGAASRWAMRNRRSLGLGFATAHGVHLVALVAYNALAGQRPDAATLIGGGGAYVALLAMVATSNDAAVRRLGARRWKRLHAVGIHWLWFVFAFSYAGRVAEGRLAFVPLLGLALGGLGLRIAARLKRRRTGADPRTV